MPKKAEDARRTTRRSVAGVEPTPTKVEYPPDEEIPKEESKSGEPKSEPERRDEKNVPMRNVLIIKPGIRDSNCSVKLVRKPVSDDEK